MSTTKAANVMADRYLAAVRNELADVPWLQREDPLATVRERLGELADDEWPRSELGSPKSFALELRESAGLPGRRRNPVARFRATRVRTKLVTAVVVVVIAALVGVAIEWAHYQPLSATGTSGGSNAPHITDSLVTNTDYYRYARGAYVFSGIELHNHGHFAVTVDGVSIVGAPFGPLVLRELRATSNPQLIGEMERAPKVKRVTVQPGKTVILFVVMTMHLEGITLAPGSGEVIEQPKLLVTVLGVHHVVSVQGNRIGILTRARP